METVALPYADIHTARIRYLDKGNGPTLLLIHGLGATHADWQKQIDFFARVFRVIAPDLRGHGDSEGEGPYTVDRLATDCSQLLDVLKIGPFFVMGHAMGGAIAMQLALFKPERVKKLVLADTLPSFVPNTFKKRWQLWKRLWTLRFMGPEALAKQTAKQLFPKPEQEPLRELTILRNNRTPKAAYLSLLSGLARWTVADRLTWLAMPTFVIVGENEQISADEAQAFAESLPDGHCRTLEGARHHLPLEKPEDFNRVTMDFLMPGSHIAATRGDAGLNWLRIDTAAQKKIDVQALLKKPR